MTRQELDRQVHKIKGKVLSGSHKYAMDERLILKEAYFEVTKIADGKGRELKDDCDICLITANNIIGNYIKFHMAPIIDADLEQPQKTVAKVTTVKVPTERKKKVTKK